MTFGSSADSTGQVVECSEAPESAIAYTSKTGPTYVSADWCTAAIGAGSNSDKITVTVDANNSGESRTAYIQVEFANNVKEWVTVTQAAGE